MHLEIFLRGHHARIAKMIESIEKINLPFKYREFRDGKFVPGTRVDYMSQVTVRLAPFGIYEIIFPEEQKDIILATLLYFNGGKPWKQNGFLSKYLWILRWFLGLEKIPEFDVSKRVEIYKEEIEIIAIGLKKDKRDELGNEHL